MLRRRVGQFDFKDNKIKVQHWHSFRERIDWVAGEIIRSELYRVAEWAIINLISSGASDKREIKVHEYNNMVGFNDVPT